VRGGDEEFDVGMVVLVSADGVVGRDAWEMVLERDGLAIGTLDTACGTAVRGRDDDEFVVGKVVLVSADGMGRDAWVKVLEGDGVATTEGRVGEEGVRYLTCMRR